MRLIVLLVLVALLMWLLKRLFSQPDNAGRIESKTTETIRQCKYCGVHVPESTIVVVDDQPYCCREHADLDRY